MFDVFTEQIEVLIKDGIAHLYWYKGDLHKAWMRSRVPVGLCREIKQLRNADGGTLTKRQQMDVLYERLRDSDYNRRLEISRNFVRILVEHKNFVPQDGKHRVETAERAALKLRELIREQECERERRDQVRRVEKEASREDYHTQRARLADSFTEACKLPPQKKGYALEKLFPKIMRISGIPVEESFRIVGEQIDGAIKYDGHFYLVELKWTAEKIDPKEIGHFHYKVEGKLEARGIVIAMNGYTDGVIENLPKGKTLRIILLDGNHLANVLFGQYTFQQLLEHAVSQASLKGTIYCAHTIEP